VNPRTAKALKRAALVLFALVLALAGAEAFLRTVHPMYGTLLTADDYRLSDNPEIGYEPLPNAGDHNSDGLRDKEYSKEKPPGVFRVVVIGDSLAYGLGVSRDQTWSSVLERLLNEKFPGQFEIINLAVPGYDIVQVVEWFKKKGLAYHPDLVVYHYWLNDVVQDCSPTEKALWERGQVHGLVKNRLLRRLAETAFRLQVVRRSWFFFKNMEKGREKERLCGLPQEKIEDLMGREAYLLWRNFANMIQEDNLSRFAFYKDYANLANFVRLNREFKELAAACKKADAPCWLLLTPLFRDKNPYPWHPLHAFIHDMGALYGMQYLDLSFLAQMPARAASLDHQHPSALGHRLIAAAILDAVTNRQ